MKYSDEELLQDLREVSEELGHVPSSLEYNEIGLSSQTTMHKRFGSWNNALREAGLEINQEHTLTDEELLQEIRRVNEIVRKTPPRKTDFEQKGKHSPRTYVLHFGSWNRAIEAAGLYPRAPISDFQEQPEACPLCSSQLPDLDFRHWRYGENEVGCYLCRNCHDRVHRGGAKVRNVDWLPHCIDNLVECHIENHGEGEVDEILDRYNMTDVRILVKQAIPADLD